MQKRVCRVDVVLSTRSSTTAQQLFNRRMCVKRDAGLWYLTFPRLPSIKTEREEHEV